MEKKVLNSLFILLIAIFAINLASAEITIGEPVKVYNLGDELSVPITISSPVDANDFLSLSIICASAQVDVYKSPFYIKSGSTKNTDLDIKLDRTLINSMKGSCYISATFNSQSAKSAYFDISSDVSVSFNLDKSNVDPSENIVISGSAIKANGNPLNGYVVISVQNLNISKTESVPDGNFSISIEVPEDAAANNYDIDVSAYEKEDSTTISNTGSSASNFRVKQVPRNMDIAIDKVSISPPYNLSVSIIVLDQTGKQIITSTSYSVVDPNSTIVKEDKLIQSGESNILELNYSSTPGYWTINAHYQNFTANKSFLVEEIQRASFTIENETTLLVKNTGNLLYNKSVDIKIGESVESLTLNLPVLAEKRFKITAPTGEYSISVKENGSDEETALGSSHLTGKAIALKDISELSVGRSTIIWSWILLILILLFLAFREYNKRKKLNFVGKTPSLFKMSSTKMSEKFSISNKDKFIPVTKDSFPEKRIVSEKPAFQDKKMKLESYNPSPDSRSSSYSSNIVTESSNKEEVAVIALKIKNTDKLSNSESPALAVIDHILEKAKRVKGKVYDQGSFKMIVFSQRLTQKLDNNLEAIKFAAQIDSLIRDFNKKYAIKIDYGLGANVGQMYLEFVDGNPKFTSIGSTTVVAKNAAEKSNKELLITSALHRKVYNVVKGDQTPYGLFKVNSILDRSQHSQFINKFMKTSKIK